MDRQSKLMWMRDILEHLGDCFDQWQNAEPGCDRFLMDSVERDVEEFRRLCSSLRHETTRVSLRTSAAA